MSLRCFVCVAATLPLFATVSKAQDYPAKPLRIVVASAPGATTDIVARAVAQRLAVPLGQAVVVDNRPGAGGNIAAEHVAKSKPDGYTLLLGFPGLVTNPFLYSRLGYEPQKDLAPVSQVSASPLLLVVHPALPVRSVRQLIALAKSKPGDLTFLSVGVGTSSHLSVELFKSLAQVDMLHVPYKSFGQGITDLMSGEITLMINAIPGLLPHVNAGRLRALAVTTVRRSALMPELPTVAEAALPNYNVTTWNGILVPAGTPPKVIDRLNGEIRRALRAPEAEEFFKSRGLVLAAGSAEEFGAFMRREAATWKKVIEASGVKPN